MSSQPQKTSTRPIVVKRIEVGAHGKTPPFRVDIDHSGCVRDYLASEDAEKVLAELLGTGEEWRQQARAILRAWRERLQDTKGV